MGKKVNTLWILDDIKELCVCMCGVCGVYGVCGVCVIMLVWYRFKILLFKK